MMGQQKKEWNEMKIAFQFFHRQTFSDSVVKMDIDNKAVIIDLETENEMNEQFKLNSKKMLR